MITNAFEPDRRPYPDDFLQWVATLSRFKRLSAELRGGGWCIQFNSGVRITGHLPGNVYYSTFSLLPAAVLDSVNWRRLVAAHIRKVRWACRRQTAPWSIKGKQAPQLPHPK